MVCIATLNSIQTIEYGESFVFSTSTSTSTSTGTTIVNHNHESNNININVNINPYSSTYNYNTYSMKGRASSATSIASTTSTSTSTTTALNAARRRDDPWSLSSSTTKERRQKQNQRTQKQNKKNGTREPTPTNAKKSSSSSSSSIADASIQLMDHKLLTKAEEYELGLKIRRFMDTKAKLEETIDKKKREYELRRQENTRRREKAAEERRKRIESTGKNKRRTNPNKYGDLLEGNDNANANANANTDDSNGDNDTLSMEEELEEYLVTKGLVSGNKFDRKSGRRHRRRSSIEDLYGGYVEDNDEDDEETTMENLGMAIYGMESYDEDDDDDDVDGISDGLTVVDTNKNNYNYNYNNDEYEYDHDHDHDDIDDPDDIFSFSSVAGEISASSQLGDAMDDIRMLTEREIIDALGIPGGRRELSKLLVEGALAKQQMIKSNVRLVTSIAKKWMRTSTSSVHANRNADNEKKLAGSNGMGDWSTPSLDEVIQQGIVGLAIAAERFEPERKFKFSTYATYYITNEVRQIMQSATTQCLYVPPYYYTIKNKYENIVRDNYRETAGDPARSLDMEEIASRLKLKKTRLEFILKSTQSLVQLDSRLDTNSYSAGKAGGGSDSENGETLADILPTLDPSPEEIVERSLLRQCLENALAAELLPLERDIVRLRHGLDDGKSRTHKEVMGSFGGMLTLNDVRTAENRAYRKLRFKNSVHNARLREFSAEFIGVAPEQLKTA